MAIEIRNLEISRLHGEDFRENRNWHGEKLNIAECIPTKTDAIVFKIADDYGRLWSIMADLMSCVNRTCW